MTAATLHTWLLRQSLFMGLAAALLLAVFENGALDLHLEALFYSPQLGDFPLRRHWFFEQVMHHGLKQACYALLIFATGVCLIGVWGKFEWLPRRDAWLALIGMLAIPASIALLKQLTHRHCPWDVIDFGGYAPYVGLLTTPPDGIARGMCFPAGHAGGGLAWIIWAIVLRESLPRLARLILIGSLALGTAMGLARMAQGAHFLSHTLWSVWWAWALSLLLAGAFTLSGKSAGIQPASTPFPTQSPP